MPRSASVIHGIVSSYFHLIGLGNKLLLVSFCLNSEVITDPNYLVYKFSNLPGGGNSWFHLEYRRRKEDEEFG